MRNAFFYGFGHYFNGLWVIVCNGMSYWSTTCIFFTDLGNVSTDSWKCFAMACQVDQRLAIVLHIPQTGLAKMSFSEMQCKLAKRRSIRLRTWTSAKRKRITFCNGMLTISWLNTHTHTHTYIGRKVYSWDRWSPVARLSGRNGHNDTYWWELWAPVGRLLGRNVYILICMSPSLYIHIWGTLGLED